MIRRIAVWFRNYFGFSRTETRGSIGLMILMVLIVIIYGIRRENLLSTPYDGVEDSILLLNFHQLLESKLQDQIGDNYEISTVEPLESFDPNTITYEWLAARGVDKSIATRWVNYLKKGGQFRDESQIKKIYGFSDSLYRVLAPYVKIPEKPRRRPRYDQKEPLIDINRADTTELKSVRGIGTRLSARIIHFRDRLGGFTTMNQLYEVYYLDSSIVAIAMKKFFVSPDFIPRKIYINTISEENLAKHPYLTYREAKLVISYREQHGDFSAIDELLNIPIISKEKLKKIEPYIGLVDQ